MSPIKQTLLLDKSGKLLYSCDSLFAATQMNTENLLNDFPFLESVFDDLLRNLEVNGTIRFPGVETKHEFLPGYYDYIFNFVPQKDDWAIQWQILDATEEYNQIKKRQQASHEETAFPERSR